MTMAELLPEIEERARQQADGSDAVWNVLARDVLTLLPAARLALDMGEALDYGYFDRTTDTWRCAMCDEPSGHAEGCGHGALLARLDGIPNKEVA